MEIKLALLLVLFGAYYLNCLTVATSVEPAGFLSFYLGVLKYSCIGSFALLEDDRCTSPPASVTGCKDTVFAGFEEACTEIDSMWLSFLPFCINGTLSACECYQRSLDIIATTDAGSFVALIPQFASCVDDLPDCPYSLLNVSNGALPFPAITSYNSCEDELTFLGTVDPVFGVSSCSLTCDSATPTVSPSAAPTSSPTLRPTQLAIPVTGCISGDMMVTTKDGSSLYVKDLKVGDLVQVGQGVYEPVIWNTEHRNEENKRGNSMIDAEYLDISVSTNQKISVTPNHYVITDLGERLAKDLRLNDAILVAHGTFAHILDIKRNFKTGMFNPQTPSQRIVINGLVVSTRTENSPPQWLMSAIFGILYAIFQVLPCRIYNAMIHFISRILYEPLYYSGLRATEIMIAMLLFCAASKKK